MLRNRNINQEGREARMHDAASTKVRLLLLLLCLLLLLLLQR